MRFLAVLVVGLMLVAGPARAQEYFRGSTTSPVFTGQTSGPPSAVCTAPMYSATGATTTGYHISITPTLILCVNGVAVGTVSVSALTSTVPIYGSNGAAAAPQYTFAAQTTTGMFFAGSTVVGFTGGGVARSGFDGEGLFATANGLIGWRSVTDPNSSYDTTLARASADVITTPDRFVSTGPVAGIGYATGAGGVVTQATSKATTVILNTVTGNITMEGGLLAASTAVSFTLTNSAIAAQDCIDVDHKSGGTAGAYFAVGNAAAGSAVITVRNLSLTGLTEVPVLKFKIFKCVAS